MACPKSHTSDGLDMQMGVNWIGHMYLTNLLLDKLKAGKPSRVINVSSGAHERGKIDWEDLMGEKSYGMRGLTIYARSKVVDG